MNLSGLYSIAATNFGGVLILLGLLWYLTLSDKIVSGARYQEQCRQTEYWRSEARKSDETHRQDIVTVIESLQHRPPVIPPAPPGPSPEDPETAA